MLYAIVKTQHHEISPVKEGARGPHYFYKGEKVRFAHCSEQRSIEFIVEGKEAQMQELIEVLENGENNFVKFPAECEDYKVAYYSYEMIGGGIKKIEECMA
jgi:hypothetical protein